MDKTGMPTWILPNVGTMVFHAIAQKSPRQQVKLSDSNTRTELSIWRCRACHERLNSIWHGIMRA